MKMSFHCCSLPWGGRSLPTLEKLWETASGPHGKFYPTMRTSNNGSGCFETHSCWRHSIQQSQKPLIVLEQVLEKYVVWNLALWTCAGGENLRLPALQWLWQVSDSRIDLSKNDALLATWFSHGSPQQLQVYSSVSCFTQIRCTTTLQRVSWKVCTRALP